jgi:DNA-binding transcriptional ArsR family regulator
MDTHRLDLDKMKASATRACRLMKVLSNPDRLMLLCQLSQGEKRVGELEEMSGITQPTLSQQLTVLREEALVTTRRVVDHRRKRPYEFRLDAFHTFDIPHWRYPGRDLGYAWL